MKKKILSLLLCVAMLAGVATSFTGCSGSASKDAFVIMTEQLDGLFNPFFYTSAPDGTIVSMTQIGMLGSSYEDGKFVIATELGDVTLEKSEISKLTTVFFEDKK